MSAKEKERLAKSILRIGYTLPGTRSFWQSRKRELVAFIEQIGVLPTFFFTLSAADLHWPELHALMNDYDSRGKAVSENPLTCVWLFHRKVNIMLKTVLPELALSDYWGRFEYQHRGSIHFHGLAWLVDAPDVSKLADGKDEDVSAIIEYFDNLVTTWNPILDEEDSLSTYKVSTNPAQTPLTQVDDIERDYRDMIMSCQRHTSCRKDTCLRRKGQSVACRFEFPKPLEAKSRIELEFDEHGDSEYKLITRRNDSRLNVHSRFLLQLHRANIDVQPIVSKKKVISYLTKYVAKSEVSSMGLKAVSSALINALSPVHTTTRLAQRLLMKTVGDSDYSAQETVHILMDLPMVLQSRQVIHLSMRGDRRLGCDEDTNSISVPSEVDRYFKRPLELNNVSLIDYVKRYYVNAKKVTVSRKRDAVVIVHPQLKEDSASPLYEEFCKYYIMQHKPIRATSEIMGNAASFQEAYASMAHNAKDMIGLEAGEVEDDVDETKTAENDGATLPEKILIQDDWMLICGDANICNVPGISTDFDWSAAYRLNPDYATAKDFYDSRLTSPIIHSDAALISKDALNVTQRKIYDYIISHAGTIDSKKEPLRLVVSGTAGTGKSFLIKCLKLKLRQSCMVMAPTGVAALAIDGSTIHSLLNIPVGPILTPLQGDKLSDLQSLLQAVNYFILDEMSMVGQTMLAKIDARLRESFPGSADCWFGGKSMILIGDFGQLPPVCDTPLYSPKSDGKGQRALGALAYFSFTSAAILEEVVRQRGDAIFRNTLMRLRNASLTYDDYKLLSLRFIGRARACSTFDNAVRLFPTVDKVVQFNIEALMKMNVPTATIDASHNCGQAATTPTDLAGGVAKRIMLAVGAKIILTANIWIAAGLCNGSQGTVKQIVYSDNSPPALPLFVLCYFDSYIGPCFLDKEKCFPVFPIERRYDVNGVSCSRRNIPLMLAWGVTVHKAQGLTLPKCCVDLGERNFQSGSALWHYQEKFALSKNLQCRLNEDARLKTISDLVFAPDCGVHAEHGSSRITNATQTPTNPPEDDFYYSPLSPLDCSNISQLMSLDAPLNCHSVGFRRPIKSSTRPAKCVAIRGDGNCFYRAVSAAVFGTEIHYKEVKKLVADTVAEFGSDLPAELQGLTVEDVRQDGIYATDQSIFATAMALQTSIAIYSQYSQTPDSSWMWMRHSPQGTIGNSDVTQGCIYLVNTNGDHFDLVTAC